MGREPEQTLIMEPAEEAEPHRGREAGAEPARGEDEGPEAEETPKYRRVLQP